MKKILIFVLLLTLIASKNFAQIPICQWAKKAGGNNYDLVNLVATDVSGNVFVTGSFQSSSITIGSDTLINAGLWDIYLAKYDASGNVLWVKRAGGSNMEESFSVATDALGNVYVTGYSESASIALDSFTLTNPNPGSANMFVVKYDASGNVLWAQGCGGAYGYGMTVDLNGNIYVVGGFINTIVFGSTTLTSGGGKDMFLAKYDASGNEIWAKSAGGYYGEAAKSVTTDVNGNIYVAGLFTGTSITFGFTTLNNVYQTSSLLYSDIFTVKYDASGSVLWAKSVGGTVFEQEPSITVDANGNSYVSGFFNSPSITFGSTTLTNAGNFDLFLVKYDTNGNMIWAKTAGGSDSDGAYSVTADASGNIYMIGFFSSPITFGSNIFTPTGNSCDMFIVKYDISGNVLWAIKGGGDGVKGKSIATNANGNIFVGGEFYYATCTLDSIILSNTMTNSTSDLFIAKFDIPILFTQSSTVCAGQNITVGTHSYAAGGTFTDTLVSYQGHDSIITTHLMVLYSSTASYIQTLSICPGQSVKVGTDTYISSGTYTYTFLGSGCDSTVTTHLFIDSINTSVSVSNATLISHETGATFQWINCNGNTIISGATSQSFIATANGSYAVIVNLNGCSDTSSCFNITTVGVVENNFAFTVNIYPNPFNSQTIIAFGQAQINSTVVIMDMLGKEIKVINFSGTQCIIEKGEMKEGIYFLQIKGQNKNVLNRKIIVQ